MNRRARLAAGLAAAVLLVARAGEARAQSETEIASLERIGKLEIIVPDLEGAAADLGVSGDALSSKLDAKLRSAGLPVAGFAVAYLLLDVTAIPLEVGPDVVLLTSLSFHQPAASTLNRWLGPARTWSRERLTVTGMSRAGETLQADVERLADAFVASWRKANPRL
ncbi:MAG: hypothetical protein Q8W46_02940 [Candidatus Palauibacterales bacterium]|nr:hypothetical protein [Candidatus Palauibacterales bacterium]